MKEEEPLVNTSCIACHGVFVTLCLVTLGCFCAAIAITSSNFYAYTVNLSCQCESVCYYVAENGGGSVSVEESVRMDYYRANCSQDFPVCLAVPDEEKQVYVDADKCMTSDQCANIPDAIHCDDFLMRRSDYANSLREVYDVLKPAGVWFAVLGVAFLIGSAVGNIWIAKPWVSRVTLKLNPIVCFILLLVMLVFLWPYSGMLKYKMKREFCCPAYASYESDCPARAAFYSAHIPLAVNETWNQQVCGEASEESRNWILATSSLFLISLILMILPGIWRMSNTSVVARGPIENLVRTKDNPKPVPKTTSKSYGLAAILVIASCVFMALLIPAANSFRSHFRTYIIPVLSFIDPGTATFFHEIIRPTVIGLAVVLGTSASFALIIGIAELSCCRFGLSPILGSSRGSAFVERVLNYVMGLLVFGHVASMLFLLLGTLLLLIPTLFATGCYVLIVVRPINSLLVWTGTSIYQVYTSYLPTLIPIIVEKVCDLVTVPNCADQMHSALQNTTTFYVDATVLFFGDVDQGGKYCANTTHFFGVNGSYTCNSAVFDYCAGYSSTNFFALPGLFFALILASLAILISFPAMVRRAVIKTDLKKAQNYLYENSSDPEIRNNNIGANETEELSQQV